MLLRVKVLGYKVLSLAPQDGSMLLVVWGVSMVVVVAAKEAVGVSE
jgi:hypothetical protein